MRNSHSVSLVPIRKGFCKACAHPDHARILEYVYDEQLSNSEAAERLGITLNIWYRHLKMCVKNEVETAIAPDIGNVAKNILDKVDEMVGQVDRLKKNIERVNKSIEHEDEVDVKKMQSYISLERQLASSLELFARLSGELNSSAIINVNNTKIEFNNFREQVLGSICEVCKGKLIKSLT